MNRTQRWILVLLATLGVMTGANAQSFPTRPLTIVVPFAAGGPTDSVARSLAELLTAHFGQPVRIHNEAGLGGTKGAEAVARAVPDGYTVLLHHIGMATAPTLYRQLKYRPQQDFAPIGLVADAPMMLLARPNLPIGTARQFAAYVRANQDTLSVANAGLGAASHLCGLLIAAALNVELLTIPYGGSGPARKDLEAGRADLLCDQTTTSMQSWHEGKVQAFAVTSPQRLEALAELPTTREAGLPGIQLSIWHGLYAPKGTPGQVVAVWSQALQQAVTSPGFVAAMLRVGVLTATPQSATPVALAATLAQQTQHWRGLILRAQQFAD